MDHHIPLVRVPHLEDLGDERVPHLEDLGDDLGHVRDLLLHPQSAHHVDLDIISDTECTAPGAECTRLVEAASRKASVAASRGSTCSRRCTSNS